MTEALRCDRSSKGMSTPRITFHTTVTGQNFKILSRRAIPVTQYSYFSFLTLFGLYLIMLNISFVSLILEPDNDLCFKHSILFQYNIKTVLTIMDVDLEEKDKSVR